jgi:hypothetical protein
MGSFNIIQKICCCFHRGLSNVVDHISIRQTPRTCE